MIEPLRSQYLAALGIENYVPRFILPGAKLSEPCAWLEMPVGAAPAIPLAEEEREEEITPEIVRRAPSIETVNKPARIEAPAKSIVRDSSADPQFALSIVLAEGGILLVDAAPASHAERAAFQQLLNNMLPALRPAAVQYALDIFIWPLTRQLKVPRDAAAAAETLAAYLNKQMKQRGIDTVLLLGDVARQWCMLDESDVRIIRSSSLLACVHDGALKRSLWNDIRHLSGK